MVKWKHYSAVILSIVLVVSACSSAAQSGSAAQPSGTPFKIGLSGALTGGDAFLGQVQQEGVRLATDEINAAGGVCGRQIVLSSEDEANDPSRMAEIAQRFISNGVDAIIGGTNDGTAKVLAQVAEQKNVPLLIPYANGDPVTQGLKWSFQVAASTSTFGKAIVDFAVAHFNKIAIFYDNNAFGQTARDFYVQYLKAANVTPVATIPISDTAQDYTAELSQARDAGAEILLSPISGTNAAQARKNMIQLGYEPIILGPPSLAFQTMIDVGGKNVEKKVWIADMIDDSRQDVKAFQTKYQSLYGHAANNLFALLAYDAVKILEAGLKAGCGDKQKTRDALEALQSFPTLSGSSISYSASDHRNASTQNIKWRTVVDGQFANLTNDIIAQYSTKH